MSVKQMLTSVFYLLLQHLNQPFLRMVPLLVAELKWQAIFLVAHVLPLDQGVCWKQDAAVASLHHLPS